MVDTTPAPISALQGYAKPGRLGRRAGMAGTAVQEVMGVALATVAARRGQAQALGDRLRKGLGIELPTVPRRVGGEDMAFVWSGPGRWLAVKPGPSGADLEAEVASLVDGLASVVDQSHALALMRLSGPRVRDVLAKGFTIDLHPRAFTIGQAATTVVAHVTVHIWQLADDPVYEVAVARSLAPSFWHWLEVSAAEHGLEVLAPAVTSIVAQVHAS